jgi:hypothetical protein
MADPTRYKVTMNRVFVMNDIPFGPPAVDGPKKGYPCYTVPAELYNSTLPDGTPFKDACATAEPRFGPPESA